MLRAHSVTQHYPLHNKSDLDTTNYSLQMNYYPQIDYGNCSNFHGSMRLKIYLRQIPSLHKKQM